MADRQKHSDSVWERLRRNRDRNTLLFTEAGVRPESTRDVICPSCGAQETAIFWSVTGHRGRTLHLLCPVCEQARVGYSLASNRPVDPVFTRGSVGGGMGVVAVLMAVLALWHFRDTPPVQMIAEDLHHLGGSLSSGASRATGGLVGSGSGTSSSSSSRGSRATGGGGSTSPSARSQPARSGSGSAGTSSPAAAASPAEAPAATSIPAALEVNGNDAPPPVRAYVSRGDRRADLDVYAARIIDSLGEREARLLLSIEYDPETDVTRVVVDPSSSEWPRRLTWLRGWRAAGTP